MNNFGEVAVIPRDSSDPENAVGSVVLFDQGTAHVTRDECRRLAKELLRLADGDATANVVATKSIADVVAGHDPDSSFDAANMTLSVGGVIAGTLLIVAHEDSNEEERNRIANELSEIHDGPVLVFAHGWRTMTDEDLADLRNLLNKSDKAMLDLLDTRSDKSS
jgi:hypothetical protein